MLLLVSSCIGALFCDVLKLARCPKDQLQKPERLAGDRLKSSSEEVLTDYFKGTNDTVGSSWNFRTKSHFKL